MQKVNLSFQSIWPQLDRQKEAKQNISFSSNTILTDKKANISLNNLQAYYLTGKSQVSFGRKLQEHMEWGATVLPDGKVKFKVWAPYAESIKLEVRSKDGPSPKSDHTTYEINQILDKNRTCGDWAYKLKEIAKNEWLYLFGKPEKATTVEMEKNDSGVFEVVVDSAKAGDMYRYVITKSDPNRREVALKDPRSQSQPFDINGWSQVQDESAYQWKNNESWKKHPNKIRSSGDWNQSTSKMITNEIHIGTFTKEGTFEAAQKKLNKVAPNAFFKLAMNKLQDAVNNNDEKALTEMVKAGEIVDMIERLSEISIVDKFNIEIKILNDANAAISNNNTKKALVELKQLAGKDNFKTFIDKYNQEAPHDIFNTIEVMPINEFYGERNWGYEGVDLFAPESSYGGPEKFKAFIDRAHELGLNVLVDVVYNHMGPFNNVVGEFGKYFDSNKGTPWGGGLNYEVGEDGKRVREFVVDNALHWLLNYNVDGLRMDMTQFMKSDLAMKEIAFEVRKHKPDAILTAEDGRNSKRVTQPLNSYDISSPDPGEVLDASKIVTPHGVNDFALERLGMDAQWNFDFQHTLEALCTGKKVMDDFYPSVSDLAREMYHGFRWFDGYGATLPEPDGHNLVNYVMSHDEAGNRDGTRLITKITQNRLGMFDKLKAKGWSDCDAGQGAARITQQLIEAYVNNNDAKFNEIVSRDGLNINKNDLAARFNEAKALNRAGIGAVFMSPGSKMFLMGDEEAELSPYKFFSQYPVFGLEDKISHPSDKGYKIGKEAFEESKVSQANHTDPRMKRFVSDLAQLFYENPCLNNGKSKQMKFVNHEGSKVLGIHRYDGKNEIFAVINFGDRQFEKNNYKIEMPKGLWEEVLNSNDRKYGGSGVANNKSAIQSAEDYTKEPINLPKHSIVVFKRKMI
ncbi:MAG: alpha amylase C-terminal domain-containing protein [Cyanobacteriota bacterium]